MEGVQTFVEFDLKDLKESATDDSKLKALVRKKLCEMAEICYLEPTFVLPFIPEVMEKIREETAKFKSGPRDFYPLLQHNLLKIQITMPTAGKLGVLFWCAKVNV